MPLPKLSTILKEASEKKTKKDKIAFLKSHRPNTTMLDIIKFAYHPGIEWLLPEGKPPYKPCEVLDNEQALYQEWRRMYIFVKGIRKPAPEMPSVRREALFIQILESIDESEAELLVSIKDKKIPYKGLTPKLFEEAFPGILS